MNRSRGNSKISNWLFGALVLASLAKAVAAETSPSEYEVKAAYIYNFPQFVEWPPAALEKPASPFVIGVTGENTFDEDLLKAVKGKTMNDHPFEVRHVRTPVEMRACHIVFISSSERKKAGDIVESLRKTSVLTVSDVDRFLQSGGMIQFILEGNKVRFAINNEAARAAGLKISSKLLRMAKNLSH